MIIIPLTLPTCSVFVHLVNLVPPSSKTSSRKPPVIYLFPEGIEGSFF